MSRLRVRAYVQADRRTVMRVLRDFEHFDRWLPGVEQSSVLAIEDDASILELSGPRIGERPWLVEATADEVSLRLRQVGQLGGRGVAVVVEVDEREAESGSEIRLRVRDAAPALAGLLGRRRQRGRAEEALHALDLRAQMAAAGSIADASRATTKILDVSRDDDGLVVTFMGEAYRLEPSPARPPS